MIKKGITGFSLPGDMSIAEKMQLAKRAGIDGIEFSITQRGELSAESTDAALKQIARVARDTGITLHGLACSMSWQSSLTSKDPAVRQAAKDNIRLQMRIAEVLGVQTILTLPGFVGVDFKSVNLFADPNVIYYDVSAEVVDYQDAYNRALEGYIELAPLAREHGVTIAIENIWSKFLTSPLEFKQFIEQIGSPDVGMYLDTGNMLLYGYPEHWIRILAPHIRQMHFKDFRRGSATLSGFVDLLSGDVDFSAVMRQVRAMGYDGWVSAELTPYQNAPEATVYSAARALDVILNLA